MIYLFDGSFNGLLTCVFTAFERKEPTCTVIPDGEAQHRFDEMQLYIETEEEKASRVFDGVRKRSPSMLNKASTAFLADSVKGKDNIVFQYLRLLFTHGAGSELMMQNEYVIGVEKLVKKITMQTSKLMGFLRFEELEGDILYAKINPTDNILGRLSEHFSDRFTNRNFIIYDEIRSLYAVYNTRECIITSLSPSDLPPRSREEEKYQSLWRYFFETIAIAERTNPVLQRQLMPKKYRKNMVEQRESTPNLPHPHPQGSLGPQNACAKEPKPTKVIGQGGAGQSRN